MRIFCNLQKHGGKKSKVEFLVHFNGEYLQFNDLNCSFCGPTSVLKTKKL